MAMLWLIAALAAQAASEPIIDVHFHASAGVPPGAKICAPYEQWPIRDPGKPVDDYVGRFMMAPACKRSFTAGSAAQLTGRNAAKLKQRNILAVASGDAPDVAALQKAAPDHVIPAIGIGGNSYPTVEALRRLHAAGMLKVIGEIGAQYDGVAPDSPKLEPYYALAEELDVPVAIHIGPGPPGVTYMGAGGYRMRLSNPLALEEVLVRHPKLRLYVMHAGWPFGSEMIALMYAHPQVYVDTGVIDYAFPRAEFHAYLKRLVEAGFGERIMFGSDQMDWPDAVDAAIEGIESASFLSRKQKRDILFNNAARFLRLSSGQVAALQRR